MTVLQTSRLELRELTLADAASMLAVLNDPAFVQFVGDRGVRTLEDAQRYLLEGPIASYARHGFGVWLVLVKDGGGRAGICGLLKRDTLEDVDLGFAFLPAYRGRGYAVEAAAAVLAYGREVLGLQRIVAITSPDNHRSGAVLEKIGFRFERLVRLEGDTAELKLYAAGPQSGFATMR